MAPEATSPNRSQDPDPAATAANTAICRELIVAWERDTAHVVRLKGTTREQVALVIALAAHAHEAGRAALLLHDAGHDLAAVLPVRQALECAVTAVWMGLLPDAWAGMLNADNWARRRLGEDLIRNGSAPPLEALEAVQALVDAPRHEK